MSPNQVEIIKAKNGSPTVRLHFQSGRRLLLHSAYNPEEEARRWASDIEAAPRDIILVYGVGCGYEVRALLRRLSEHNLVFAVEPFGCIRTACAGFAPLQDLHRDSRTRFASEWAEVEGLFDAVEDCCWRNIRLAVTPSYRQFGEQSLQDFASQVFRQQNTLQNLRSTVFHSAARWQANLFANLIQLAESAPISRVFGSLGRRPAIIVSAGPSLDKNVELLREAGERALIIATGTAARLLSLRNIRADLVLAVDAGERNYLAHFQGVSHRDSVLVFDPTVYPAIPREHHGPKSVLTIYPDSEWLNQYVGEPIGLIKTGGSVSNVAFDLACRLDADPIILTGQDLAYTGTRSHASGAFHERFPTEVPEAWLSGDDRRLASESRHNGLARWYGQRGRLLVPSIDGRTVPTDRVLYSFLVWFEQEIARLNGSRTVVDASEGGALIKGSRILSLRETLERYCEKPIGPTISRIREKLTAPAVADLNRLERDLRALGPRLVQLDQDIAKGRILCAGDSALGQDASHQRYSGQVSEVDARIVAAIEELKWRFHFILTPLLVTARDLSSLRERDPGQLVRQRELFYVALGRLTGTARRLLDGALNSLEDYRRVWSSSIH